MKKALKYDQVKPDVSLVPNQLILGTARALTFGVTKYGRSNYLEGDGLEWHRTYAAMQRHLLEFRENHDHIDSDSGLHCLDLAAAELAMMIEIYYRNKRRDA